MSVAVENEDSAHGDDPALFGLGASLAMSKGVVVIGGLSGDAFIFVTSSNGDSHKWSGDDPVPPPSVTRPSGLHRRCSGSMTPPGAVWGGDSGSRKGSMPGPRIWDMDLFRLGRCDRNTHLAARESQLSDLQSLSFLGSDRGTMFTGSTEIGQSTEWMAPPGNGSSTSGPGTKSRSALRQWRMGCCTAVPPVDGLAPSTPIPATPYGVRRLAS